MKISAIIALTVLALSANANANPIEHAQCAAVFKVSATTFEQSHPGSGFRLNNASRRLKNMADSVIGMQNASQYYVSKMNEITTEVRSDNGTGIHQGEIEYCVGVAKSYGMM